MSDTTTIRLSPELKAKVAAAAEEAGTTTHSFILEAIAEKAAEHERRSEFHRLGESRFAAMLEHGKTIPWSRMRAYMEARAAGKRVRPPVARKVSR